MNTQIVDIADLDVIFLTYDEPKKEEFWIKLQNMVPWAKRVDGVKGSDAAHKAAANASDTDRFILIDGDNIPDPEFFNLQLQLNQHDKDCVFRWKARNYINGLMYGNGGISCWTKEFVLNMRTHENTDGRDETLVEFCFDPKYIPMHNCYSTTYPNQSAFQAWRAGFREGVKMCLNRGRKPSLNEFEQQVHSRNYDNLVIWQSVGCDVDNGIYAIYGSRIGTWLTMIENWDYTLVQSFDEIEKLWLTQANEYHSKIDSITTQLKNVLGLPIVDLNAEQSKFFKYHYRKIQKNLQVTTSEVSAMQQLNN